jgi:Type II secretion system (T2SS), protein M subtype b
MPDLKQARTRLYVAIGVLLVVDIVAVIMLVTPVAGRDSLRQQELRQLWLNLKARESAPWRGLDRKIPQARQDIQAFYRDRFPAGYSAISTDLARLASQSGVTVASERYTQKDTDLSGLQSVQIEAEISGDYIALVKFINALERNKMFFLVDDLQLGGEQTGSIKLGIRIETYLRST